MQRLSYMRGKPPTLILLSTLIVILMMAFSGLNRGDNELSVQAFYSPIQTSPIKTPTPLPTLTTRPTPQPSPTPQIVYPPLLEIEAEIELRKSIGFRSDIEYVKAVRSSDDVIINERFGRVALTPDEAKELEARLNLEKDGNTLLDFFENEPELYDSFGGIYLEHAADSEDETAGGALILQLVEDHTVADDLLAILPPLQYPERLRIELVAFSDKRLQKQFQAISDSASQHLRLRAVSIDRKNNRVEVIIAPANEQKTSNEAIDKASLPSDLAALVADSSVVVREGVITKREETVRGGDSWSDTSGGSSCTLGFKVTYFGTYSMLTAGHCIPELGISAGDPVYHNTTQIGTYSGVYKWGSTTSNGTGIDAAILYLNDWSTAYDDVINYSSYRDIHDSTPTYVTGYWRCWTGKNSGTQCGVINCTSSTYYDDEYDIYYIDMFTIDPAGGVGDSGAPAYRPEPGSKASVTGVKSGSVNLSYTSGFDSDFSKWHNIRDYWSLTLVTDTEVYLPVVLADLHP